jgi:hypothetical protein
MPALLATLHDLAVGGVIAVVVAGAVTLTARWYSHSRYVVKPRTRPAPEMPVDFDGEIRAFKTSRDELLMGERRVAR